MVRFIFFCMAVMALSLAAIPLTTMVDGISGQRADILAVTQPAAGEATEDNYAEFSSEPSADDLNAIESAAGGIAGSIEDAGSLSGGFGGTAPKALDDAPAPVSDAQTPQDN